MAAPVVVTLDRSIVTGKPIDLTRQAIGLKWSSVMPGGFASCEFSLAGDPRSLTKKIPYLSIVRVVGSSGRILFEGQVEDKSIFVTDGSLGLTVTAFGLQNALREQSVRRIWSKRDLDWADITNISGMKTNVGNACVLGNNGWQTNSGQFDPTDASKQGVQIVGVAGSSLAVRATMAMEFKMPIGLTPVTLAGTCYMPTATGVTAGIWSAAASSTFGNSIVGYTGLGYTDFSADLTIGGTISPATIRIGAWNSSGGALAISVDDGPQFYNMRLLGTSIAEDVAVSSHAGGGYYGGTLIRDLLAQCPALVAGVIESGSDFTIEYLDASVRRTAFDILNEIASYYSREWAVWESATLDWKTPNLTQSQWVIPISQLAALNLDASTDNSKKKVVVLYTDAASGLTGEASSTATDRRNPYVLAGRAKDVVVDASMSMTANTSAQFAARILQDLGFGPVPAAGSISLTGESVVQHAQGNAMKAWEIRAGDNVTIPELPMIDVFTQDGRGEVLFHVVSNDADAETGLVTLTLDSYGSRRSDVLLARLAAVTNLLGG